MTSARWLALSFAALFCAGCEQEEPESYGAATARREAAAMHRLAGGPCVESVTLVATTSGSPNAASCLHPKHKARVGVATLAGEEIGATVLCECVP